MAKRNVYGYDYEEEEKKPDERDYGIEITQAMQRGESAGTVRDLLGQRQRKIAGDENLQRYANDDITQRALSYLQDPRRQTFDFQSAPQNVRKYQEMADTALKNLQGMTYQGYLESPEYGALQRGYTRGAQRAMQETTGDIASRTGGLASSYASTAGQQAYGRQMTALEQAAIDAYNQQRQQARADVSALSGLARGAQSDYLAQQAQEYGIFSQERGYQQDAATDRAKILLQTGDYSGLKSAYGLDDNTIKALEAIWRSANPKKDAIIQSMLGGDQSSAPGAPGGLAPPAVPTQRAPVQEAQVPNEKENIRALSAKISEITDRGVGVGTNIKNLVRNYYNQGLISEETAKKILADYGIRGI